MPGQRILVRVLRRMARPVTAGLAGVVLSAAFDPLAVPYVIPVCLAALALTLRGCRVRGGLGLGLVFGASFYFVHIFWMAPSIGPAAWIGLSTAETLFYGAFGALAVPLLRRRLWPAWLAVAWTAMESVRSTWPLGGMPWGRLGFAVVDTPAASALAYVGVTGVGLLLALLGFTLARLLVSGPGRERLLAAVSVAAVLAALVLPAVAPYRLREVGRVTVAAVQGNVPGRGDDVAAHYRQVSRNQLTQTLRLAQQVGAGTSPRPDFVVWPENSTAIDPFLDVPTNAEITRAVDAIGVPILVGALVDDGPGHVLNQGIVWSPTTGAGDRYTKWHPVPYGEYIPFRDQLAAISLRVDEVPRDMDAGTRTAPLDVAGVPVADLICFDVAYDDVLRAQVESGAQLVTVQTSNASFIETDQIEQQFDMTRARALETGRYVVVASINGVSGVITPDGTVLDRTERRTAALLTEDVGLRSGTTPGLLVERDLAASTPWLTLAAVIFSVVAGRRRRSWSAAPARRRGSDTATSAEEPAEHDEPTRTR